jgi:hypothetical protein
MNNINPQNMRSILITLILLFHILPGFGQSEAIMEFHDRYKDTGKYFTLKIEGGILKSLAHMETNDEEADELINLVSKIEAIDIHSISRNAADFSEKDMKTLEKRIRHEKFEDLMYVNEKDRHIKFMIRESNGRVSDLVMLVDEPEEFLIFSISGDIDLRALAKLSGQIGLKGCENFDKLEKN